MTTQAVIMAGGVGLRLWPLSDLQLPKQFIKAFDKKSLFQLTVLRNIHLEDLIIMTSTEHQHVVHTQLEEIGVKCKLIVEEIRRNTGFCSAIAANYCISNRKDNFVLIPSDHIIYDEDIYKKNLSEVINYTNITNTSCLLGVKASTSDPSYGYIVLEDSISSPANVKYFCEKPDSLKAKTLIEEYECYWNSGIYCFNTQFFLEQLSKHNEEIYSAADYSWNMAEYDSAAMVSVVKGQYYLHVSDVSIDVVLTEKLSNLKMVRGNFAWSDVGNWKEMWKSRNADQNNNYIAGRVIAKNVKNSYISSDNLDIVVIGLDDIVVINNNGKLLVSPKNQSDILKELLKLCAETG